MSWASSIRKRSHWPGGKGAAKRLVERLEIRNNIRWWRERRGFRWNGVFSVRSSHVDHRLYTLVQRSVRRELKMGRQAPATCSFFSSRRIPTQRPVTTHDYSFFISGNKRRADVNSGMTCRGGGAERRAGRRGGEVERRGNRANEMGKPICPSLELHAKQ